jgi:hypothetical protein
MGTGKMFIVCITSPSKMDQGHVKTTIGVRKRRESRRGEEEEDRREDEEEDQREDQE